MFGELHWSKEILSLLGRVLRASREDFSRVALQSSLREVFERFDTAADGSLDAAELKLALRCLGEEVRLDECERLIRSVDADGDGVIDFHEFQALLAES